MNNIFNGIETKTGIKTSTILVSIAIRSVSCLLINCNFFYYIFTLLQFCTISQMELQGWFRSIGQNYDVKALFIEEMY